MILDPLIIQNKVSKHDFDFFGDSNYNKPDFDNKKVDFSAISNVDISKINFPIEFNYKEQNVYKPNKNEKVDRITIKPLSNIKTDSESKLLNEDLQQYVSDLIELNQLLKKVN